MPEIERKGRYRLTISSRNRKVFVEISGQNDQTCRELWKNMKESWPEMQKNMEEYIEECATDYGVDPDKERQYLKRKMEELQQHDEWRELDE